MATNNAINNTLGVATATSLVFSPTSGGINGVIDASSAAAGYVGQVISSQILFASAVSFTNGVARNISSISLTAGDWDIYGNVYFGPSISNSLVFCGINSVSATLPDNSLSTGISGTTAGIGVACASQFVSISSTTIYYLVGVASFATGTTTGSGLIYARRRR